jgi:predicted Zn-dependent protease
LIVAGLGGCTGGAAVSPSDQTLIRDADKLHAKLESAVVERLDAPLKRYFEQIGARITAAAKELDQQGVIKSVGAAGGSNAWMFSKDVDFHLVDSDLPNSFTSGGRHVYIYDGLFQLCRNEDELAAVFCHEYAHLYGRHVQQDVKRDPALSGDDAVLYPFATLRLSPGQNREADAIAFQIYCKAGWDPGRYVTLYQRMLEERSASSVTAADREAMRERVVQAQQRADALPPAAREWGQPPVADDARFAQLQSKAKGIAAGRNRQAELLLSAFPSSLNDVPTPRQARAREQLFPPPAGPTANPWGKGLPGQ